MFHTMNKTSLAWLSLWAPISLINAACGGPFLEVEADDLFAEAPGAGGSPGSSGMGGAPSLMLPPGYVGAPSGGGAPAAIGSDAGATGPAPSDAGNVEPGSELPNVLGGATYAVTSTHRLLLVDRTSGASLREWDISGLAADEELIGMDFRPADRQLYALARSGNLYRIDPETGAAELSTNLTADPADTSAPYAGLAGSAFGVDFNPVVDRLRVVSDTGQNLRVNVDTGRVLTDGVLNPGAPNVTAAAYSNAFGAACRTRLYGIDAASKQLLVQDPPNDGKLAPVGGLGVSGAVTGSASFDVLTLADATHQAFAVLELDGVATLFDVDLGTGRLSGPRLLELAASETIVAISAAPPQTAPAQAMGELIGLTEGQRIVSFNRTAPGKLCTQASVTGLSPNEGLLGLDVRPADAALYALGSLGNVYTVDAASGSATLRSALYADPSDVTSPYAGLSDSDYGLGFNPVPDRLRAVGSAGQNLRINVDTGATFTDGPVSAGIGAIAYANAFAGAKATTLFALDASAGALVRIGGDPATGGVCPTDAGNPNCGVVTPIMNLGQGDVSLVAGLDIDGRSGASGSALLALSLEGSTTSSLYVVDLDTGLASAPPGVTNASIGGGERISALTLAQNPVVEVFVVTSDLRLMSFSPRSPGVLDRVLDVSNLDAGETLVGIDFRAADGALYALGSSGRLYVLDTATGAATLVAELSPASSDDNPFWGLDARASHGVDFNPAADLLRVVSDWGQNLRVVPSARSLGTPALAQAAGATFTDLDLGPDFPSVLASAYANNFAGATRTTLFAIDAVTDQLLRQGGPTGNPSPNTGVLSPIGSLGVDAVGEVSFDISGGRDGLALAVMETVDSGASLYSIALGTGVATPLNATGNNLIGDGTLDLEIVGVALRNR